MSDSNECNAAARRRLPGEAWDRAVLLCVFFLCGGRLVADEQLQSASPNPIAKSTGQTGSLVDGLSFDFSGISKSLIESRMEMAPQPRVSRSRRPLRRITLVGGDRFDAECLNWGTNSATFRLLNGQVIRVPVAALAAMSNPPGEIDVLDESFEADSAIEVEPAVASLIDQTQAADGRRSLKFGSNSPEYRLALPRPLAQARIEFSFKNGVNDPTKECGEWQLEWANAETQKPPVTVRIGSNQRITAIAVPQDADATTQSVGIDDGWHTFIAIVTPEKTRLIVDDAILASFHTPDRPIRAVRFPARRADSKNALWIDAVQVRRLSRVDAEPQFRTADADDDSVILATRDELFGRLLGVNRTGVLIETFGEKQSLPWNQLSGMTWKQPPQAVCQTTRPTAGIVSEIEMQPLVDRPGLPPARWTATVLCSDSTSLIAQHPLVGELTIPWPEVRRIDSIFPGKMLLLDARTIHLGNSIRTDFHRHLPDGTEFQVNFRLDEIPRGRAYLSLEVAELEAAGPTAPPGSPFLAELRSGRLITEAVLNDHRIGSVNSFIRFKATPQNPDRVRVPVPRGILNVGENSFRLRQLPLKYPGREFDDCEVANFRLEFDLTDDK